MPNVPIQTGKKQFKDSFGNTQDVTIASALGPLSADEAKTGPRFQPIEVWGNSDAKGHDPRSFGPQAEDEAQNGYGNACDDPEYLRKFWGHP